MRKKFFTWLFSILFSLGILELGLFLGARFLNLNMDQPGYSLDSVRYRFWADMDPVFGTWHQAHSKYHLKKSCIDVQYRANSYGARDVERLRHSRENRVVVLGDSFMEGYGVPDSKRVSNLLEQKTGISYLNFATSGGFGLTQEYLLYKSLAKYFDHQTVLVGILPFNDFLDDDPDFGEKVYSTRYKPYLVGEYPDYKIVYSNSNRGGRNWLKSFLRGYTYTFNAIERLVAVMKVKHYMPDQNKKGYSGYYDYTPAQLDRMKYALEGIQREAKGKELVVFTIPVISDFIRFQEMGRPKLVDELSRFAEAHGFRYLDLLPEMIDGDWDRYKLACDNHWSEFGNKVVAGILYDKLGGLLGHSSHLAGSEGGKASPHFLGKMERDNLPIP